MRKTILTALGLLLLSGTAALAQQYVISTVAGGGTATGDGGPATSAQVGGPAGVAVDSAGSLYIAAGGRIRKVSPAGIITTVAGGGTGTGDGGQATNAQITLSSPAGLATDGTGNLYIADTGNSRVRKVSPNGIITTVAQIGSPLGVAVDPPGNLYILSGDSVLKVSITGIITTVAPTGSQLGTALGNPFGMAVDNTGNVYLADTQNNRILKVSPSGTITTVAGSGSFNYSGDGGPATKAGLTLPVGLTVDSVGNLYIAEAAIYPQDFDCCGGGLNRIRKVSPSGIISTVAGNGTGGYSGDGGPATSAQLNFPYGVAVDSAGNVYVADLRNNVIRRLQPVPNPGSGSV